MKVCSKCCLEKELTSFPKDKSRKGGFSHRCKECNRERFKIYASKNQEKLREYRENYKKKNGYKNKARSFCRYCLKTGKIKKKMFCEKCGCPDTQAHHEDYNKPLEVIWLCRQCHIDAHNV